ncbi:MAG TPA: serine/threonine protein kinase, partial [Planctomycetaceae bacterium]|nr:serine/threonine protein kinase [Planctomycetaceae bacterium]
ITHRDIKPGNLLLDLRGTIWVADFGLAKSEEHEDVTHTGDIIGTLRYMAPETFDGHAGPRSDIYSLGLTLYELLVLRPAFDETERNRLMRQVLQTTPPRLRTLNPAIPRDLETIVLKAIDRDPARRYQTADELMADLQRFLNDEPILARRVTALERLWRWCRRNPVVSWTALAASVAILTTAVTAFVLVTRERDNALRLAAQLRQQAKRMARLAVEKSRLAEQERQARLRVQEAKAATEAALAREEELRRQERALRQAAEKARNRADQAAKEAEAVTNFLLLEMHGGVNVARNPERDLSVRGLLDRAAQRADKSLRDQPLQQAAVRAALGQAYRRLGLFDKAERQVRLSLEARRRLLGPQHPVTLATANLRARVLYRQRKISEAYETARATLTILEDSVGREHPVTLTTTNTVALCLVAMRRFAEAQELCEQALSTQRQLLGPEHADTLDTMNTLAITLYAQRQFQRARKVLAETLGILQRVYGPDHPQTLQAMANLAGSMLLQGDGAAAQDAYAECWDLMKQINGPDHPITISIEENLAVTMMVQKDFAQAERLLREALALRQQVDGPRHWRTLNTAGQLGVCLSQQRRFEEAEKILLDSAETMMADSHTPPGFVRLALQRLVNLYRAWKKPDLVNAWRSRLSQLKAHSIRNGTSD